MGYADKSVPEKLTCNHALTNLCDLALGLLFRHTSSVLCSGAATHRRNRLSDYLFSEEVREWEREGHRRNYVDRDYYDPGGKTTWPGTHKGPTAPQRHLLSPTVLGS